MECRRILKWTYAYGFYRFDTLALEPESEEGHFPEDSEAAQQAQAATSEAQKEMLNRKEFFEFLQVPPPSAVLL